MSDKIKVGSIVEGKVIKIKPFGAIVSLPDNSHGLVHISQVATKFIENVTDVVNIGDTVQVKVLSIDGENNKISLSIKEAKRDTKPTHQYQQQPRQYRNDNNSGNSSHSGHSSNSGNDFELKFKDWQKEANEKQAGLNKRNKRR